MRGLGRIARAVVCVLAFFSVGGAASAPAAAKKNPPQAKPGEPAKPKPFDVCKGLTGGNAPTKVAACTEAIKDGKLAPQDQALAYLNRGLSESGPGSEARSKDDYKAAIRIFNELILGSPMQPYYYTQRGVIYQTIGEADRAIPDLTAALKLKPCEVSAWANRGIVYKRKGEIDRPSPTSATASSACRT